MPEYLQVLKSLAEDCTFSEVTAVTYCEEWTRDAFINGLSSASIRQRLLERAEISLVQAFELAEPRQPNAKPCLWDSHRLNFCLRPPSICNVMFTVSAQTHRLADCNMNYSPPCPSTAVAQRRVNKEVVANLDISHVCVSRKQDINPHLLRLSFLSHRSKNRILLALPLVSNLL